MQFKPAIIESPFRAQENSSEEVHRIYLNRCIEYLVLDDYTPYASHKMLVDSFDDTNPAERKLGMEAGLEMSRVLVISGATPFFCVDYGWTDGMQKAKTLYLKLEVRFLILNIGKNPEDPE